METFFALLAFCVGNSPVTGEFLSQRPVTRGFDVFFDLHLSKQLSKKSRRRWFETTWRWLWRHYNEIRNEEDYSLSSKSIYTVAFATCLTTFFSMVQIGQIVQLLTHWGRYKMAAISQTILSNSFSWMKMLEFRLKFHQNLFHRVQFTIFQHCLKQWWLDYRRIYASLGLNELTYIRYPYL